MRSVSSSGASSLISCSSEGVKSFRISLKVGEGGGDGDGGVGSRGGMIPCFRNASLLDYIKDQLDGVDMTGSLLDVQFGIFIDIHSHRVSRFSNRVVGVLEEAFIRSSRLRIAAMECCELLRKFKMKGLKRGEED